MRTRDLVARLQELDPDGGTEVLCEVMAFTSEGAVRHTVPIYSVGSWRGGVRIELDRSDVVLAVREVTAQMRAAREQ